MNATEFITLIAALVGGLGGLGALLNALFQRGRGKSQSETEARAQKTDEFRAVTDAQWKQIADLRKEVESIKSEMIGWQTRYQSSEDYIDVIIAGVYEGRYPPFPARN